MVIKRYSKADERKLLGLLRNQGADWACYHTEEAFRKYKCALLSSITYTAYCGGVLCGYVRCREDSGFGVYVCDLLVDKSFRGAGFGRKLMDAVCADYPNQTVYVMSDVDAYYEKQGFKKEGSIFVVKPSKEGV